MRDAHSHSISLALILYMCLQVHISTYVTAASPPTSTLHSTITSTIATLTTTITLSPSSSATPMEVNSSTFETTILNSTNTYRTLYQATNVTYDDTLAEYALDYAKKCIWEHSGGPHGENLALGYPTFGAAVDAWAAEESLYSYASAKFSHATGHFTQLVWKNTTRVGCGAVNCTSGIIGWLLVCEYEPRGNVQGSFGEMVGMRESREGVIGMNKEGGAGRAEVGMGLLALSLAVLVL